VTDVKCVRCSKNAAKYAKYAVKTMYVHRWYYGAVLEDWQDFAAPSTKEPHLEQQANSHGIAFPPYKMFI
jgi:hypothetical protein